MAVKLKEKYLAPFVSPKELEGIAPMVAAAARQVEEGSGLGNDFLGWVHYAFCILRNLWKIMVVKVLPMLSFRVHSINSYQKVYNNLS